MPNILETMDGRPPLWNLYEDGISQSMLWQFLACPEKIRLSQIEGYAPARTGGALAFGSLIHEALDRMYNKQRDLKGIGVSWRTNAISEIITPLLAEMQERDRVQQAAQLLDASSIQLLEENYGLAQVILEEYFQFWEADLLTMDWVGIEDVFRVPYKIKDLYPTAAEGNIDMRYLLADKGVRSIPVNGKFDGTFRQGERRKLWLFETKTKSRIEEDTLIDTLPFNLQVCMYLWAMKKIYREQPEGVLYNIIRKPQLKQGNAALPDFLARVKTDIRTRREFYFMRYNVSVMPDELERWASVDFAGMLRSIISWYESGGTQHFRNSTACSGAFGRCEFLPICSRDDISTFIRKEQVFPELQMAG